MGTFHDVRLPIYIERGAREVPDFDVTILPRSQRSRIRKRNLNQPQPYRTFDISYGLNRMDVTSRELSLENLLEFFYARQGSLYSFRFRSVVDWEVGRVTTGTQAHETGVPAGTVTPQSIATGNGIDRTFQVIKKYEEGTPYERFETIEKLVDGTTIAYLDGVEQAGVTFNNDTGQITFPTAPAIGEIVQIYTVFDYPVIFSSAVTVEMLSDTASNATGIRLELVGEEFI